MGRPDEAILCMMRGTQTYDEAEQIMKYIEALEEKLAINSRRDDSWAV